MAEVAEKEIVKVKVAERKPVYTLRAIHGKNQQPCKITPLYNRSGVLITGQSFKTEEEKKNCIKVVTEKTTFLLEDGAVVDTNIPEKAIDWEWAKIHPYIAKSLEAAISSSNGEALFYIENKEKEAQEKVKKTTLKSLAQYKIINEATLQQRADVAKVLGLVKPESWTEDMLTSWLLDKTETPSYANLIVETLKPENRELNEARIFVEELVHYRILDNSKIGFKYANELWRSKEDVTDYVLNDKNFDTTNLLRLELEEKKKL